MPESKLDVIIDPKGAIAGAKQVTNSLKSISTEAQTMTEKLRSRFDSIRSNIFSLQGAFVALGLGAFAKSLIDVTRNLEMMERGMRTITTSSGQAALQLDRVRKIADEFMLQDLPMANAFRLLASHDIPDTEKALRTLGNVALALGEDIETVTIATLAGQERTLRRLGVRIVDLGQGQVDLIFGKMEIRAAKTDASIRKGLLQLFEKGFPDQTKKMGDSLDFQLKRVTDAWEDFRIAVMKSGLGDFLTAAIGTFADSLDDKDMAAKGKAVGDAIKAVIKTIARDVAFVIDMVTPLGKVIFDILGGALRTFDAMPPAIQTIGIFGAMMFGLRGFVVMTAGLYLMDKLGLKADDLAKGIGHVADASMNLAAGSPLGQMMQKATETVTGKKMDTRPKELSEETLYIGLGKKIEGVLGSMDKSKEKAGSAAAAVEDYFNAVDKRASAFEAKRAEAAEQAKRERAAGASGTTVGQTGMTDEQRKQNAQLEKLKKDTGIFVRQEAAKRDVLFDPDKAEAMAKAIEYANALEKEAGKLGKDQIAIIGEQFLQQVHAVTATKQWVDLEDEKYERMEAAQELLMQTTVELQEAANASKLMEIPLAERDLENAKMKLSLELQKRMISLLPEEKQLLVDRLVLINDELTLLHKRQLLEDHHVTSLEETARLLDEAKDLQGGTAGQRVGSFPGAFGVSTPSRETLIAQREREFHAKGMDFDAHTKEVELADIDAKLAATRVNWLARTTFDLNQQTAANERLVGTMGLMLDARQAELRVRDLQNEMAQKGIKLSKEEEDAIRKNSEALQKSIASARTADAVNSFVDHFRVGWDTIVKSGEQAYDHLEDAMTQWIMAGKLDITTFANFVSQELIRMGIRASITQLMGSLGGGSGGGGLDIMGLLGQGFNAIKGPGFGAAATSPAISAGSTASAFAQRGGIVGFQRGGISMHSRMIAISEGNTPEAIIPLRGGKVPVQMSGGRGTTIHAPITIVTPDAAGVRRSETQIQAQMSSTLVRASRRIN